MGCSSSASRATQNVVPINLQQDDKENSFIDESLCQKHGGKVFTKYDENDNALYCEFCVSRNRNASSRIIDITKYVNSIQFKQKHIKTENEIRSKKRDIQAQLSDVNDNISALNSQKTNLTEEVNNFRSSIKDIINYLCDGLCERVAEIHEIEKKTLEKHRSDLTKFIQKLSASDHDNRMVQNPDALKLLNMIGMENTLLNLSRQALDNTFVDIQLKLHDNIALRKLLHCDQTASALGEIIVLRNIKAERPCTKDLIVHDISDGDDDDEMEDDNNHTKQQHLITKQDESLRSKTPHKEPKQTKKTDDRISESPENLSETKDSAMISKLSKQQGDFDSKGPTHSTTPRIGAKSRIAKDLKSRNATELNRDSVSRLSHSVKSNFSIMTPSSIQFSTPANEKRFFERNAKLIKSISLPFDKKTSNITSSVIMPNGNVILCDRSNRKLWYFDPTFRQISNLLLDYEPHNLCLINDRVQDDLNNYKVAVSFPSRRLIQIVDVSQDDMSNVDEVRTEPECWGICGKGKTLVFSTERGDLFRDVGDYRNYRWRKYRYTFQKPISLTIDKDIILVCNWGLEEVSGNLVAMYFDDRGKNQIKFSYSNRFLKRPVSCSVDCEDNIYVCDAERAGIHQVSPDGSQYRVLDIKAGHTDSWQHINFVPESDYFILTEAGSNLLYVFQMS